MAFTKGKGKGKSGGFGAAHGGTGGKAGTKVSGGKTSILTASNVKSTGSK